MPSGPLARREFFAIGAAGALAACNRSRQLRPIVINLRVLFDQAAHGGKGLNEGERALFKRYMERASREFAVSSIVFDTELTEGAFLRQQGYSDIPDRFLERKAINLFVTQSLAYDIDRDRTGGCSTGPRPPTAHSGASPFFETFIGLREASGNTLAHEFAHHLTLDTQRNPTAAGNFTADFRNDYWLWRQRHGVPIMEFRACVNSVWARTSSVG